MKETKQRPNITRALLSSLLLFGTTSAGLAQGTGFTYEGRLNDTGQPANGLYDLRFTIYDSPTLADTPVRGPLTNSATGVTNGLFSVTLDFGSGVFTGPGRWLEIAARTNGAGAFITLTPRQALTAAPYAIMANASSNLLGTLPAVQLTGTVPTTGLTGTYSGQLTFNNPLNHLCGDGSCLTGVNAAFLDGLGAGDFWQLAGNASTTPGVNFLGTKDNNSLVVKVNNTIALRYDPAPYAPNLIAGLAAIKPTIIFSNVSGAVVGGGGAPSPPVTGFGAGDYFAVFDNDGTIGGGFGNKVGTDNGDATDAAFATVGGGVFNTAAAYGATVAGGDANYVPGDHAAILGGFANQAWAQLSGIGGGFNNLIYSNASFSTIAGGYQNSIQTNAFSSAIAGGQQNVVGDAYSFIGAGTNNTIQSGAPYSTIAGGSLNAIQSGATYSTIGGGLQNVIQYGTGFEAAWWSVIGGGQQNTIQANAGNSFIGGGGGNNIGPACQASTIAGGLGNSIEVAGVSDVGFESTISGGGGNGIAGAYLATIAGGSANSIGDASHYSVIGGGQENSVGTNAEWSTIAGGWHNVILPNASGSACSIGGGYGNSILTNSLGCTIAGGSENTILSYSAYSTIPGGSLNRAAEGFSFAAGHAAQALYDGDFVWADNSQPGPPLPVPFSATGPNQFLIRAAGGVGIGTNNPHGQPLMMGGGAYCTGMFWVNACDRNVKEDFSSIAPREILAKVKALPITEWKYKTERSGVKHLGPVAQDFHEAFGLGDNDKAIGTVDEGGVALAAIQGLNQLLEEKDSELKQLVAAQARELKAKEDALHSLEQRLERLEQQLSCSAPGH